MMKTLIVVCTVLQMQQSILSINIESNTRNDITTRCPQDCNCVNESNYILKIDCSRRPATTNDSQILSSELDILLSDKVDRLISFTIVNSQLVELPQSVCRLTQLRTLNMTHNKLRNIPTTCFHRMINLQTLVLSGNQLEKLQNGLFDSLSKLKELHLHQNVIDSVGLHVFSNSSDLQSLRLIDLSDNRLTSIEPWPIIRGYAPGLTYTDTLTVRLSNNHISKSTNFVGWKFNNIASNVYIDMRTNGLRHVSDILRPWDIYSLQAFLIMTAHKHNREWIHLKNNPFNCDCVDYEFFKWLHQVTAREFSYRCQDPKSLANAKFESVPLQLLVCNITDHCPDKCSCIYRPADISLSVNCSQLSLVPNNLPPLPKSYDKYKVNFSRNRNLRRLGSRPFFINVSSLDISYSALEATADDIWLFIANMTQVSLRGNFLKTLPKVVTRINMSESLQLNLGLNPWSCACENGWLIEWLKSIKDRLQDANGIVCDSSSRFAGKELLQLTESEVCAFHLSPVVEAVVISVSVALICAIAIAVPGITYCLRFYCYRRWKLHPFDRDECSNENMQHDVFLCCSFDEHFDVAVPLLTQLESHGYDVCYHLRDFSIGETIENNIMEAIEYSKRVVCLLTTNFIRSPYCLHEFELALHHTITIKRRQRLIVLMMLEDQSVLNSDVDEQLGVTSSSSTDVSISDASKSIRHYMSHNTYIDCVADSDWFNNKLLYALPENGLLTTADVDVNTDGDDQLLEP